MISPRYGGDPNDVPPPEQAPPPATSSDPPQASSFSTETTTILGAINYLNDDFRGFRVEVNDVFDRSSNEFNNLGSRMTSLEEQLVQLIALVTTPSQALS
ncbi:hypothetical protein J1N35_011477 [Gossypium stocksii]|uniref:Uncharacterized protein n=1 Tax=Gossypium stocksii TaxID=47602 RepID=A0A9D3W243_9ROSI|nr:hypothetical protein J1N35_011477 [Gossypium stocksii]